MRTTIYLAMLVLATILASCNTKQQSEGSTAPAADTAAVAKTPAEPGDRGYIVAVGDTAPDFTLNLDNGFPLSPSRSIADRWLCCSSQPRGAVYAAKKCHISKAIYGNASALTPTSY